MKIVHLVTDQNGGAARAAKRISAALNENENVTSIVMTRVDITDPVNSMVMKIVNRVYKAAYYNMDNQYTFTFNVHGIKLSKNPEIYNADIIHLHWVSNNFMGYNTLRDLLKMGKPIVWTLHDMNPFTGGCHYDNFCLKFLDGCGNCPAINSNKKHDFSKKNVMRKKCIVDKLNLAVVGCSKWITCLAKKSEVFSEKTCMVIPNCIDSKLFYPIGKIESQKQLKFANPQNKKIVLFGAIGALSNSRKGYIYLKEAINCLEKEQYMCLVFGGDNDETWGMDVVNLGNIVNDETLNLLYNVADVFVAPSVQENLANTVMESLACGTPVVAFNIGGMPDMIDHMNNGYLAEAYNIDSLVQGIRFCCKNSQALGVQARMKVLNEFSYAKIAQHYCGLYKTIGRSIKDENR